MSPETWLFKSQPFQSYILVLLNYPVSSQLSLGIVQPPSLMLLPGFKFSPDHKALLVVMYTLTYMNWCMFPDAYSIVVTVFFFSCNITKAFCWSGLRVTVIICPSISVPVVLIFFLSCTVSPYLLSFPFP